MSKKGKIIKNKKDLQKVDLFYFGVPIRIRTGTEGSTNPSANHYTIGTIHFSKT